MTPTATASALLLKTLEAMSVAMAEAAILTRLFPMRMEVSRPLGLFTQILKGSRTLFLVCRSAWNLALDRLTKAVSEPEKKAERKRQQRMVTHSQVGTDAMANQKPSNNSSDST